MKKLVYLILMLLGVLPTAQASPVDVSYTVSGSAGNWALDFSITNNLGSTYDIYPSFRNCNNIEWNCSYWKYSNGDYQL